jgi:hypothetical protein
MSESEAAVSTDSVAVATTLKRLVAVHLAIGLIPAASCLVRPDLRFLPLLWAMSTLTLGQLMLLSFWAGMGTSKGSRRLLGSLLGVAYVAAWPVVGKSLSPYSPRSPGIGAYLVMFSSQSAAVFLVAGVFFLIRRRSTELRHLCGPESFPPPARFQYSILHLLLITSVVAVVLGLARGARPADTSVDVPLTDWRIVALIALVIVTFLVNSLCAAWAALGIGRIRLRVALVLLVAAMLGFALSLAARHDLLAWWLFAAMMLITVLPTAIVIVSLLVVRSCGYRLVPKVAAPRVTPRTEHGS